ncbi:MAG: hypothetical protein R3F60_31550 [bacterium]
MAWKSGSVNGLELAFRALGPGRIVVTDNPPWVDAHTDWVADRPLPAGEHDLVVEQPPAPGGGTAPRRGPRLADADGGPGQRWLDERIWDVSRQIMGLRLVLTLHRDRLDAELQARPVPGSALAETVVDALPERALARVPRDAAMLVALHLPPAAWAMIDRVARAAEDDLLEPAPGELRHRLFRALAGELMLGLAAGEAPPLLVGSLRPADPATLAEVLAELPGAEAFSAGGRAVRSLQLELGPVWFSPGPEGLLAAGPLADGWLRGLLEGAVETGPGVDGDLADAWRRVGPGICCVAVVDVAALRSLVGPAPPGDSGPPILAVAGAPGGVFTLRLEVPAGQIAAALWSPGPRRPPPPPPSGAGGSI